MSDTVNATETVSATDRAIALAKARKAEREAAKAKGAVPTAPTSSPSRRARRTEEERKEMQAKLDAERAERKAKKALEREAKKAAKLEERKLPHMGKVEKAAARLPLLTPQAQELTDTVINTLTPAEASALTQHVQHHLRAEATAKCVETDIEPGDTVEYVGANAVYLGQRGTVTRAARIRCYVDFNDGERPFYCFLSEVKLVEAEAEEEVTEEEPASEEMPQTGTDG